MHFSDARVRVLRYAMLCLFLGGNSSSRADGLSRSNRTVQRKTCPPQDFTDLIRNTKQTRRLEIPVEKKKSEGEIVGKFAVEILTNGNF